jgi:cation diffusion facilitator family transporter
VLRPFASTDQSTVWRTRVALVSVIASALLVIAKLAVAVVTNSLALYSEAGHSAVDTIAVLITFAAIRQAGKPPDRDHLFGHAKYESIAALIQLIILFGLAGVIVYNACKRLFVAPSPVEIGVAAFVVMGVSICVEGWRTFALVRAARKTRSEALAASSKHFLTDLLDSLVVIFGLVMTRLGYPKADSYAALFVAAVILWLCVRLTREVFHSLTDRAPEGLAEDVEHLVLNVADVIGVHDIRVRQAGPQYFTEMHVSLAPHLTLGEAHDVLDRIEATLQGRFPGMHVVTHPEPYDSDAA